MFCKTLNSESKEKFENNFEEMVSSDVRKSIQIILNTYITIKLGLQNGQCFLEMI